MFQPGGPASEDACFELLPDSDLECNEMFKLSLRLSQVFRDLVVIDPNSNEIIITIVDDDGMVKFIYF